MPGVKVLILLSAMTHVPTQTYGEEYFAYQTQAGAIRRLIRYFYLRHTAALCRGQVLDFGCGAGALLRMLPSGSRGLDVNPHAVAHCRRLGLRVDLCDPDDDDYGLHQMPAGQFGTLVLSHVLEHLPQPDDVLRKLCAACARLRISRIVLVVPCAQGFHADATHRTFVDRQYFESRGLFHIPGWKLSHLAYFPINLRKAGDYVRYQEMVSVLDYEDDL